MNARICMKNEAKELDDESMIKSILLYDDCIRPTLHDLAAEQLTHWPINYDMAMAQYRDVKGLFHFGSVQIAPILLADFAQQLLFRLNEHNQFKDAFFCHETRGLKGATIHNPADPDECNNALQYLYLNLTKTLFSM